MPTYDYVCKDCAYKFEKFQSMSAEPLKECPKCEGYVERKIGAGAGLVFKGSGFYITDYKKKNNPPNANSVDKSAKTKNSNSETKKAS